MGMSKRYLDRRAARSILGITMSDWIALGEVIRGRWEELQNIDAEETIVRVIRTDARLAGRGISYYHALAAFSFAGRFVSYNPKR